MKSATSVKTLTIDPAIQITRVLMHFASVIEMSHCAVTGTHVNRTEKNYQLGQLSSFARAWQNLQLQ